MSEAKTIVVQDESSQMQVEVTPIDDAPRSMRAYPRPHLRAYQAVEILFTLKCEDEIVEFEGHPHIETIEGLEISTYYDEIHDKRAADVRLKFWSCNPNMKGHMVQGTLWTMVIQRITWGPI